MRILHIANTNFESELAEKKETNLFEQLTKHPIVLLLQYLPFLYGSENDGVLITHQPEEDFWNAMSCTGFSLPKMHLFESENFSAYERIESWGASKAIVSWAKKHALHYSMPPWDVVCTVNSKAFSFEQSPKLPGASLLHHRENALEWFLKQKGPCVLKTCFGVSGKGHLLVHPPISFSEKVVLFLEKEWKENRPVIAEPWVKRILDFSTQWILSEKQEISCLGATLCENDLKGQYRKNISGNPEALFGKYVSFLEEHLRVARPLLEKIAKLGYFGNVGIDAMLYYSLGQSETICLHPIVEINARKTMGWVALQLQQKYFQKKVISLSFLPYQENARPLLPQILVRRSQPPISSMRNLFLQIREI